MRKKINNNFLTLIIFFMIFFHVYSAFSYMGKSDFYNCFTYSHPVNDINKFIKIYLLTETSNSEDLTLDWKSFETSHLVIIYPDYFYNFALYISNIAEDVYIKLSEITKFQPTKKVILLISGKGDFPNGYVTIGPRGLYVTIYAVYPYEAINYGLDSYGEWYKTLISHEFAHIFHIGERSGVAKVASKIFGQIIYPNGLTPVFYREGFAVNFETLYSNGIGRARSNYTEMYLRTAFSEDTRDGDILIDRFSSRSRMWPFTEGCYLYGASFLKYLATKYDENILYKLNSDSSSFYYFPWISSFKKETGKRVVDLWDEWLEYENIKQKTNLNKIRKNRVTNFVRISSSTGYIYSVSLSTSGRYGCYSISDERNLSGLYMYDFYTKKNKLVKPYLICENIFFDDENNEMFYIRKDYDKKFGWLKNLYCLDLKKGKEYKITESGHISDFKFYDENNLLLTKTTQDRNIVYFAKLRRNSNGNSNINLIKITNTKEIFNFSNSYWIESLTFSPDKSQIAFSGKNLEGKRSIVLCRIQGQKNEIILDNIKVINGISGSSYFPKWVNNRFLTFINDSDGIYNLYMADLFNNNYYRLTNLETGILKYDISKYGDVIGKIYSPKGFFVGSWKLSKQKESNFFFKGKYEIAEFQSVSQLSSRRTSSFSDNSTISQQKSYNSFRYLIPSYWLPVAAGNGINFGIGFFTINREYLGRFDYSFALVYDLIDKNFKLSLSGIYNFPIFSLFGNNLFSYSPYNSGFYNINPNFSFYYGIENQILKYNYIVAGKLGVLRETPFIGARFIAEYSNVKLSYQWNLPIRGLVIKNDIYWEMNYGNWVLNRTTINFYIPIFNKLIANFGGEVLIDFSTGSGLVYMGQGLAYFYAPVNGIGSSGYRDIEKGDIALDEVISLKLPFFQIERGVGVFPFYLNNIYGSIDTYLYEVFKINYSCNDCIRLSMNFSLNFNTTIFYDFPTIIKFGYIYAPMKGGDSRVYFSFAPMMN